MLYTRREGQGSRENGEITHTLKTASLLSASDLSLLPHSTWGNMGTGPGNLGTKEHVKSLRQRHGKLELGVYNPGRRGPRA